MRCTDEFDSGDENTGLSTRSTPLLDLNALEVDGEGQEELKSLSKASLNHGLNEGAIEGGEDDFFDSVKFMFSNDQPVK